ncbi:hypothetical protein ACGFYU_11470 [Streptomyces sp. NPDC048337]|uniref:hypothetical protein n=1 Tax=Streptomyces sp. NPDC048337 TaxID=3365535 RepID=UPI00371649D7
MARLYVDGDLLVVHLSWWEKISARQEGPRVPLAAVADVSVVRDWWRPLRGARVRGRLVPSVRCLGTWRHATGRDFVAIRARHLRVVRVDLRPPSPYARISVSDPESDETAAALRTALDRRSGTDPRQASVRA